MTRYRCRLCGERLIYVQRTFTYRHAAHKAHDHAPLPQVDR